MFISIKSKYVFPDSFYRCGTFQNNVVQPEKYNPGRFFFEGGHKFNNPKILLEWILTEFKLVIWRLIKSAIYMSSVV